jgi:hypothetical protein
MSKWKFWVSKPDDSSRVSAPGSAYDGWERDGDVAAAGGHPALDPAFHGSRSARPPRRGFFREAFDGLFIDDVRLRSVIRAGVLVTAVFFAIFITWGTTVKLDAAVTAPGLVKVDGSRWTVQHPEGGMVE